MTRLVKLDDRGPLVLRKDAIPGPLVAVCRCGLSAAWPLCDGSHVATRSEQKGRLYRYARDEEGELSREEVAEPHAGPTQRSREPAPDDAYA